MCKLYVGTLNRFDVVHQYDRQTDRQTDGQNCNNNSGAIIMTLANKTLNKTIL